MKLRRERQLRIVARPLRVRRQAETIVVTITGLGRIDVATVFAGDGHVKSVRYRQLAGSRHDHLTAADCRRGRGRRWCQGLVLERRCGRSLSESVFIIGGGLLAFARMVLSCSMLAVFAGVTSITAPHFGQPTLAGVGWGRTSGQEQFGQMMEVTQALLLANDSASLRMRSAPIASAQRRRFCT